MNTYIRDRLRADASHLIARARAEKLIVHKGLRGRFRELLVDAILAPWLPPYAACGTGMIVDIDDRVREATQEDIVIFDRSLVPAVLAHTSAMEGVFPLDGVLARVEVKSKLTRSELQRAVLAGREIYEMHFCGPNTRTAALPISAVFAFASDLTGDSIDEFARLLSVVNECGLHYRAPCKDVPGPIVCLCVVGRGCWFYGRIGEESDSKPKWFQAKIISPYDEVLHVVGAMSNSCFFTHISREGVVRDSARGAGGGIGHFILSSDTYEVSPIQNPDRTKS